VHFIVRHGSDVSWALGNEAEMHWRQQKLRKETTTMRMAVIICSVVASVGMACTSAVDRSNQRRDHRRDGDRSQPHDDGPALAVGQLRGHSMWAAQEW
jgi:hypothetical protein